MTGQPDRSLLFAAPTAAELRRQLDVDDRALLERDDVASVPSGGPCRLAIVNADAAQLARARRIVEDDMPWRGRQDIWFTPAPLLESGRGSVAIIFPGVEQHFQPAVDDVASHFGLASPDLADRDQSVLRRSIAVIAVGRLLDTALRRIGVEPAAVAGHSIGEWNAMISAGLFSTASMDRLIASVDPAAFELPDCLFAALGCGVELAEEMIAGVDGVVVSHDNCPHQSIVCGEAHAISTVVERLRERGVLSQILNFRSGFHSPMLGPYVERVSEIAKLPIGAAAVPVWSATTAAPFPSTEEAIRRLVIRHLLERVRFRTLIERLYASGIRAFVQAGVGSLTAFIDDTLAGRDYVAVAATVAHQRGLLQLRRTAAALWVEGAPLKFERFARASSHHAVILALEAVLADAADASRAVTARLAEADTGEVRVERRQARYPWTLGLRELPFVLDHCLLRQPRNWPALSDRQPVVPLTTAFELMRDVARRLVPERIPIALEKVSARRWLALDKPLRLDVTARFDGRESVDVSLGDYATATVIVRHAYPGAPTADTAPFTNERHSPVRATQLYSDHWLFHGPQFQGIEEIGPFGDDGLRGTVRALPSTGALVDTAGQLMVFWIMAALGTDRFTLPAGVESVEFFGIQPAAGTPITATVRIRSVTPRTVYADLELAEPNGRVWARLTGFENRRFATDDVIWPVLQYPERNTLSQSEPGGWVRLTERWTDAASRELIARRYLGESERDEYRRRAPRGRRHWLMGRIAAKDAVRRWLWSRGSRPLFPVELTINAGSHGRPAVNGPGTAGISVSIAHSGDLAVAIAHERSVGIDVEIIESRDARLETIALSEEERLLLDRLTAGARPAFTRSELFTRLWTAKEAASKADGTGLNGRPAAFAVNLAKNDGLKVTRHDESGTPVREYDVDTRTIEGPPDADGARARYIVAWTFGSAQSPPSPTTEAASREN